MVWTRLVVGQTTIEVGHLKDISGQLLRNGSRFVVSSGRVLLDGRLVGGEALLRIACEHPRLDGWIHRLSGQFAIAVGNLSAGVVEVARDRGGHHPCFTSSRKGVVCFATDPLDAARLLGSVRPNDAHLARYASVRYDHLWGCDETFFAGVLNFPPASIASTENGFAPRRYWQFSHLGQSLSDVSDAEFQEQFRALMRESTSTALSGHPGATSRSAIALSSGIDSTVVASTIQSVGEQLPAVTVSFLDTPDSHVDESASAEAIAEALCASWTPVEITRAEFLAAWKTVGSHHAFPLATSAQLGLSLLYRSVSDLGFDSLFVGGSGDNLFAGNYPAYLYNLADLYFAQSPSFSNEANAWIELHSTVDHPKNVGTLWDFMSRELDWARAGEIRPKASLLDATVLRPEALHALHGPSIVVEAPTFLQAYMVFGSWYSARPPSALSLHEASRSSNLSIEDVYSADEFVEFAWRLPSSQKIRSGQNKWIVREAMRKNLPPLVLQRKQKLGFDVPLGRWLSDGAFQGFVIECVESEDAKFLDEFLDLQLIRRRLRGDSGPPLMPMLIWQLVSAIRWRQAILA